MTDYLFLTDFTKMHTWPHSNKLPLQVLLPFAEHISQVRLLTTLVTMFCQLCSSGIFVN